MKILVADDDAVSRTMLKRTLERSGFDVVCVADGQSAVDCLLGKDAPRMAILDWVMPGKDGPAVCREVRADDAGPTVYLILLTAREAVEDVVMGFEAGADDYLTKPCNPDELKARLRVGARSLELQDSLLHEAEHDSLTKLPNRAFFVKRLTQNVRKARELPGYQFTLLFIDINRFKHVNDSLGHTTGDELMKGVARRLLQSVRVGPKPPGELGPCSANIGMGDLVARIGGDEFVILLENLADLDDGVRVAERIQQQLRPAFMLAGCEIFITASIGISTSQGVATESSEVLRGADAAMYKAKSMGKARYHISDSTSNAAAVGVLKLENDLRRALENEEFEVYYQPIVRLGDSTVTRFEALVRWNHPTRGLLQPGAFIPVAEESGLIVPMGAWVMREACRQAQEWNANFRPAGPVTVCVNISPRQFGEDNLVQGVRDILVETGLDPRCLELEVTENLTMQDAARAVQLLTDLSKLGVSISLDDFGTGCSSLSYLLRFPISTLKIDQSFVANIARRDGSSAGSSAIVQTIIALGHNLGMKVVAEGIETSAQMEVLGRLGCDLGQGYLLSRPVAAYRATEMLRGRPFPRQLPSRNVSRANHNLMLVAS